MASKADETEDAQPVPSLEPLFKRLDDIEARLTTLESAGSTEASILAKLHERLGISGMPARGSDAW